MPIRALAFHFVGKGQCCRGIATLVKREVCALTAAGKVCSGGGESMVFVEIESRSVVARASRCR
jgi:hypothetical protein